LLGGADAGSAPPSKGVARGDAASAVPSPAVPPPAVPPAEAPLGRLREASARPLGLIEELVNRTLRLYLGL
jgi:hypothetical protein